MSGSTRYGRAAALALGLGILSISAVPALADNWHGRHRHGGAVYVAPSYYYGYAPPQYYAPPPRVYYAPPPVYYAPPPPPVYYRPPPPRYYYPPPGISFGIDIR
jgi:hypothetical protein